MLEKYETASRLISADIENIMTEALMSTPPTMATQATTSTAAKMAIEKAAAGGRKRKLPGGKENNPPATGSLKRFKSNELKDTGLENKEVGNLLEY